MVRDDLCCAHGMDWEKLPLIRKRSTLLIVRVDRKEKSDANVGLARKAKSTV